MKKIVYYVATSLDGFIAGKGDDISKFILSGDGVEKYQADLAMYQTVIMGRRTYEFGYQYGLVPGQPAYPHMHHHIFSDSMDVKDLSPQVSIEKLSATRVNEIKAASETDVYLCGGGIFAGWLLENGLIDQLKIKVNPIVLGEGVKLFGGSTAAADWKLTNTESFDDGLQILTYDIIA